MKCLNCDKEFIPRQKFCCASCRASAHHHGLIAKLTEVTTEIAKLTTTPVTTNKLKECHNGHPYLQDKCYVKGCMQ